MDEMEDEPPKREVEAKTLVEALTRQTDEVVYTLRGAAILGKLDLRHRIIRIAIDIQDCEFRDEIDLRYCEFTQAVNFSGCHFHKDFNSGDEKESRTIYRKDFICDGAVFEEAVSFVGVQCEGSFWLRNTHFKSKEKGVDFTRASCETLECTDATFKGAVTFNTLRCENTGVFNNAKFENEDKEIDFIHASFGRNLECTDATFKGGVTFSAVRCEDTGFFNNAKFENEDKEISFAYASFVKDLRFDSAYFTGPVSMEQARISYNLNLHETDFQNSVDFYSATIGQLCLGGEDSFPFKQESLDLRQCTLEWFQGTEEQAKYLVQAQHSDIFSRDPYLQLEKYYRAIGNEAEARDIYYQGRCALREKAMKRGGSVKWTSNKKVGDWLLKRLTGYGVKTHRLLVPILIFVILGTMVFWQDNALRARSTTASAELVTAQISSSPEPVTGSSLYSLERKLFDRIGYSLDLFLPVLNLRIADRWEPTLLWREIYVVAHVMAGWLLIPLLIASLSGLVRSQ